MITYRQLATNVAILIKQPYNHELNERIKDSFKAILATRIRQSFNQYGIDETLKLNYPIKLEHYTPVENKSYDALGSTISINDLKYRYKSINKVLKSVRFINEAPFTKVSTLDGIIISFMNQTENLYTTPSRFSMTLSYYLDNGYLVLLSNKTTLKLKTLLIESIFEDMDEVSTYYSNIIDAEDAEIPFPLDMINSIIGELLKTQFGVIPTEPVNIELVDNKQ